MGCTNEEGSIAKPYSLNSSPISLTLLPASETGITFNNTLKDDGRLNVFVWNFLYSGAGVAAGDINNDGLPDLYFAANQGPDKLYLNKGNFKFEDITSQAGLSDLQWSTGVTMVDINADGLLDIYVCKNSALANPEVNRNKLWINLGNNQFSEQSREFGLDDPGFSVQATFFDLDNDGDLDVYLVNQPFDQFAQHINPADKVENYPSTDRLYLNDKGRFVDKTKEMGLVNHRYGLNVSVADFNLDGWVDLYVSNDYHHADHLYMNHEGRLVDELQTRTGHISFYAMGSDVGDINNDGLPDLISLDMAFDDHYRSKTNMPTMQPERFWALVADHQHYQYPQNTMQLNTGSGYFTEIAQLAGLSKTDWSASPLFVDLDNDGKQDLLVTNGIQKDMKNNDFNVSIQQDYRGQVGPDNFREVLSRLPSNPVHNRLYRNAGNLKFDDLSTNSGFDLTGFSHGMAYADFDGDGLMDIAVNNMNATASIYKNNSPQAGNYINLRIVGPENNTQALGIKAIAYHGTSRTSGTMQSTRGFLSSSDPILHFGLDDSTVLDSLLIIWNHREISMIKNISANQTIKIYYKDIAKQIVETSSMLHDLIITSDATFNIGKYGNNSDRQAIGFHLNFTHTETPYDDYADQILLPYKLSQNGPFVSTGDLNNDSLADVFVGGAAGQASAVFLQKQDGGFYRTAQKDFEKDMGYEDMQSVLADFNQDGFLDIYAASGSNEFSKDHPMLIDRIYLNDGNGIMTYAPDMLPNNVRLNGQCVVPIDFERDGDTDLFVFGRLVGGQYIKAPDSKTLINTGTSLVDKTYSIAPFLNEFGMVTDATVTDIDGDGDDDLLVVGEWMAPTFLINSDGHFTAHPIHDSLTGIWWSVTESDINNDGRPDFILGNLGWNNKFGGRNANLKAYAGDIDSNGDYDVILAKQKGDHLLPVRGRECSSEEMPFLLEKYPTYDAFGKAHLKDILNDMDSDNSVYKSIGTFSSLVLINQGNMNFETVELPVECQTGPMKASASGDFNQDGVQDFIYAGNHYPVEVETARYDALQAGIAYGDAKGNFKCIPLYKGKKPVTGDFRDIKIIETRKGTIAILTRNDGDVEVVPLY